MSSHRNSRSLASRMSQQRLRQLLRSRQFQTLMTMVSLGDTERGPGNCRASPRSAGPAGRDRPKGVSMARISGLSDEHAAHARKVILKDVKNMLAHKRAVHYSQRSDRWEGIDHRCTHLKGTYPKHCDCSSTTTWMLWDAIARTLWCSGPRQRGQLEGWLHRHPVQPRKAGQARFESEGRRPYLLRRPGWRYSGARSHLCRRRIGLLARK
jgi:hypothetical protein